MQLSSGASGVSVISWLLLASAWLLWSVQLSSGAPIAPSELPSDWCSIGVDGVLNNPGNPQFFGEGGGCGWSLDDGRGYAFWMGCRGPSIGLRYPDCGSAGLWRLIAGTWSQFGYVGGGLQCPGSISTTGPWSGRTVSIAGLWSGSIGSAAYSCLGVLVSPAFYCQCCLSLDGFPLLLHLFP